MKDKLTADTKTKSVEVLPSEIDNGFLPSIQENKTDGVLPAAIEIKKTLGRKPGYRKYSENDLVTIGNALVDWMKEPDNLIINEFLLEYDLYSDFLNKYMEQSDLFSSLVKKAKDMQLVKLQLGGLNRKFDCANAIWMQKAVHKLRENDVQSDSRSITIQFNLPASNVEHPAIQTSITIIPPAELPESTEPTEPSDS